MDISALSDIAAAFAQPVTWNQKSGLSNYATSAVAFNARGDDPIGTGNSVRQRGYEIPKASLPFQPANGDTITADGQQYRVIDVMDYEEARAWRVQVELL
jgi:hypothetical protein